MVKIKFIDLFAGIGGLRTGFENAFRKHGLQTECVFTSEIKEHAKKVLNDNYDHSIFAGDITQVHSNDIPDFDFLLAGFPCQAFSSAGKRLGFLDTRGTLFFEVERILRDKDPYGFILENVEGLIKHDIDPNEKNPKMGRTLKTILESLNNLGYKVTWNLLDSKDFGVPQSRKRVFIVGTKGSQISLTNFESRTVNLKTILEKGLPTVESNFTKCLLENYKIDDLYGKQIKDKRNGKNNIHSWDIKLKGEITNEQKLLLNKIVTERRKKEYAPEIGIKWMDGMSLRLDQISRFFPTENLKEKLDDLVEKGYLKYEYPKDIDASNKRFFREDLEKGYNIVAGKLSFEFGRILDPEGIAPTIVATDVSRIGVVDGEGIRKLTAKEGARLFGFDDNFKFNLGKIEDIFDLLGNTVVVPVVETVTERLVYSCKEDIIEGKLVEKDFTLFNFDKILVK